MLEALFHPTGLLNEFAQYMIGNYGYVLPSNALLQANIFFILILWWYDVSYINSPDILFVIRWREILGEER